MQTLPQLPIRSYKSAARFISPSIYTRISRSPIASSLRTPLRLQQQLLTASNIRKYSSRRMCVCVCCSTQMIHLHLRQGDTQGEKISLHNYVLCSRPVMNTNMAADCIVIN